jgi:hypothetical protein
MINPPTEQHFKRVIRAFIEGDVIPFLGAGINLYGRKEIENFEPCEYLPNGRELAAYLADEFEYPSADRKDLLRVSQYAAVMQGSGPLYRRLGELFDANYPITALHRFFARLPRMMKERGSLRRYQLIVTTNYDDVLERAFEEEGEPFDLVTYVAKRPHRGKFRHIPYGASHNDARLIDEPNKYSDLPMMGKILTKRTVILKIHGAVDRALARKLSRPNCSPETLFDSFVITEDDYINYLALTDFSNLLPSQLKAKITNSGFLFLGYGLRDWNLRVILHRIWSEQELDFPSWAIQLTPDEFDERFWGKHNVDIIGARLEEYIPKLYRRIRRRK